MKDETSEVLQAIYDSEITFSISSDCWDGGFTVKVGAIDPYGEKWAVEESGIYGIENAINRLHGIVIEHYPKSKYSTENCHK